jgi:hypothetical protein
MYLNFQLMKEFSVFQIWANVLILSTRGAQSYKWVLLRTGLKLLSHFF